MKQTDLLMTDFTIEGNFHDMALYSGILYLWKDERTVRMYNWKKWMKQITISELPIYQYALPTQFLSFRAQDIETYCIKEISFSHPVRDFFLFRHQLYFITAEGFFEGSPESSSLDEKLLLAGNFHSLALSEKDRVVLSSKETGVFEYFLASRYKKNQTVIQWDDTPTADVIWNEHLLLQMDELKNPIQLLTFQYDKKTISLRNKRSKEQLHEQESYSNMSLNLKGESKEFISLFDYLTTSDASNPSGKLTMTSVQEVPNKYFPTATLDETILYIQEEEHGLYLLLEDEPYLIPKEKYVNFRTFHKSHNYRNHLHLLSQDAIKILVFNKQS